MKVKIRTAKPKDWKIIQKLNNEVFIHSKEFDPHLNHNWPFSKEGENYYKKITSSEKYFCAIAEVDSKPVSYLAGLKKNYSYRTNSTAEIENMGTLPKMRSFGIGTKLINEFNKWCTKREITHIKVTTYFHSDRAINFYKKQGLKPIDITLEGKNE